LYEGVYKGALGLDSTNGYSTALTDRVTTINLIRAKEEFQMKELRPAIAAIK
jgi:hypothetical protein